MPLEGRREHRVLGQVYRTDTCVSSGDVEIVAVDKGLVGKLTDVFPWVSDDDGLVVAPDDPVNDRR